MYSKALIVDDAPFIREVLRATLMPLGLADIIEAENGSEAIDKFKEFQPEIIFMDIVMPEKSGLQAVKEIREINKDVKIVAMTTLDQEIMQQKALDAGCDSYLIKPFKKDEIIKLVEGE